MHFTKHIVFVFLVFCSNLFFNNAVFAESNSLPASNCIVSSSSLLEQRMSVVKQYLKLLGEGKYKELLPFFTPDAMVSDTVKGLKTASEYYNGLYAYLTDP